MSGFDDLLARHDPDRRLAALFAPERLRERLFALYAFHHEVARTPDDVTEPMIGEMRLAWAREAVEDLFAAPARVRRHDVYEALNDLRLAPGGPDRDTLVTLVEARAADLGEGPFPTPADRRDYVDRTAVTLMKAAARLCRPDAPLSTDEDAALTSAGRLWGFTGLLRAFPALADAGRPPFAAEELAAQGVTEGELRRGSNPDKVKAALESLIGEARAAADAFNASRGALPAEMFPAVGYAGLARGYLREAEKAADPFREPVERPLVTRQWRLVWGSLTGRI
jgi:phytoene synthase